MPPPQLFISITSPPPAQPVPGRTIQVQGNISWLFVPSNWSLTSKSVSVQFGAGDAVHRRDVSGGQSELAVHRDSEPDHAMGIVRLADDQRHRVVPLLPHAERA